MSAGLTFFVVMRTGVKTSKFSACQTRNQEAFDYVSVIIVSMLASSTAMEAFARAG